MRQFEGGFGRGGGLFFAVQKMCMVFGWGGLGTVFCFAKNVQGGGERFFYSFLRCKKIAGFLGGGELGTVFCFAKNVLFDRFEKRTLGLASLSLSEWPYPRPLFCCAKRFFITHTYKSELLTCSQ
ncbi:MAG: hypothetical protein B7Y15_05160 [Bacteroidetes bacterium 24-39-8]|nr:MAG: hypothetical protein B7Y76_09775 [Sphingobacteriia bacterium 35-40-5]OYZ51610.1 MAG: hypothetical protein B7Y15_05160 [Bacteroidetes bacterium 24-39-8]OZA63503.1 MAG: hypothetical protein B7X72_10320 [Sphingobacteriia bacterium 39-39-8]